MPYLQIKRRAYFMRFGGFLDNHSGGGSARIVTDIPYSNNHNMPTSPSSTLPDSL
ncbi:unnamed protein product [Camellia sinensis]